MPNLSTFWDKNKPAQVVVVCLTWLEVGRRGMSGVEGRGQNRPTVCPMTDGDDDELAGSQRKRLRLDDAEIRKFYDPKLAERVVAFRESDLRDKEHALVVRMRGCGHVGCRVAMTNPVVCCRRTISPAWMFNPTTMMMSQADRLAHRHPSQPMNRPTPCGIFFQTR